MREFLRAAAAWAESNMGEWPWAAPKDEDDEYYFVIKGDPGQGSENSNGS